MTSSGVPPVGTRVRKKQSKPNNAPHMGICPGCSYPVRGTQRRPAWTRSDGTWHMDCLSSHLKREKLAQNQEECQR